jgi:hypothetical protein
MAKELPVRKRLLVLVSVAVASLAAGCSTQPAGGGSSAYMDGYNFGDSFWPTAKNDGLSDTQECANQSSNAPGNDDLGQWEAGCVAAGKSLVTNSNDTGGS